MYSNEHQSEIHVSDVNSLIEENASLYTQTQCSVLHAIRIQIF